jgi:hypothetical protein
VGYGKSTSTETRNQNTARNAFTPEVVEGFQAQRKLFIEKFGREPGADDPIFFDPTKDQPQPMDDYAVRVQIVNAMSVAGIAQEYIYAYQKTGLMPTKANQHLLSKADLEEWDAAIADYNTLTSKSVQ